ncbi:hypothetical protein ACC695_40530, partial [Rhizobium ruizarguesonis]
EGFGRRNPVGKVKETNCFLRCQPLLDEVLFQIAATVSLKFSRFKQSRSVILGGILSGFMLYVITVLVKAFGSSGVVPP